jgi:hypothetical protein
MRTKFAEMRVSGLVVQVVRKNIKNLNLGVYPPDGRVRIAAPLYVTNEAVRRVVAGKLGWIKRHQARFRAQSRQSTRESASGEFCDYLGHRYRLRVVEDDGMPRVEVHGDDAIEIHVRPGATAEHRGKVMQNWYRQQLRGLAPALLEKWQTALGVQITEWRIKKMKTRWGSCNAKAGRIWLNLELAKKPVHCIEYLVVHELAHLIERSHNGRFNSIMSRHMPDWRSHRKELNASPLAHETWSY